MGDSPELSQLCREAYQKYRRGGISSAAYNAIYTVCLEEETMSNEKVFQMKLQKVYPLLVAKAEKKGRSRGEVDAAACWLTGYSQEQLAALLESDIAYGDFFR